MQLRALQNKLAKTLADRGLIVVKGPGPSADKALRMAHGIDALAERTALELMQGESLDRTGWKCHVCNVEVGGIRKVPQGWRSLR